jgi:hypothetical protein
MLVPNVTGPHDLVGVVISVVVLEDVLVLVLVDDSIAGEPTYAELRETRRLPMRHSIPGAFGPYH